MRGGEGGMRLPPPISSTGFPTAQPATARTFPAPVSAPTPGGDLGLSDRLASIFSEISPPSFDAQTLDRLQKAGGVLGGVIGGPAGLLNLGVGQFARVAANEAFPTQEPIGFFEDILAPDIFAGSPFDIQVARELETRPGAALKAAQAGSQLKAAIQRDVERGNRPGRGRTAGGAEGRRAARSRGLSGRGR